MIEITGVGFPNKGAELMLASIVEKESGASALLRVPGIPRKYRASVAEIIPRKILSKLGVVTRSGVNHILDASGFAYGDQLGSKNLDNIYHHYCEIKKRKGKIIFLPQAFGSFEKDDVKEKVKKILELGDLVYARERQSLDHLHSLGMRNLNLKLAPDFTNGIEGYKCDSDKRYKESFVIIPNARILDKGAQHIRESYLNFLLMLVKAVQEEGLSTVFLNHEGTADLEIIHSIEKALGTNLEIIEESNALRIKGLLSSFKAGFSSRYHGAVSLLSQAIPCLCAGWSHKYYELFNDYEASELLFEDVSIMTQEMVSERTQSFLRSNLEIKEHLEKKSIDLKDRTNDLWQQVGAVLVS